MRYGRFYLGAALVAGVALAAFASVRHADAGYALGRYAVGNLSCGACVANIQNALGGIDGIGAVQVSVTTGEARVEFQPIEIDADEVAGHISRAGYPAQLSEIVSSDDYRNLREDESRLAARYVGRIGEELVSRQAFAECLARVEAADAPRQGSLLKTAWQELLQRQLLLAAAAGNGVVVQDGEVALELEALLKKEGFEATVVSRFGDLETYRRELKEQLVIERNIEQFVLKGEDDPQLRRQLLNSWYRSLVAEAKVSIFDPALKAQVEGGKKGCGGCC